MSLMFCGVRRMKINSGIANLLKAFLITTPITTVYLCLSTKEFALGTEATDSAALSSIAVLSPGSGRC